MNLPIHPRLARLRAARWLLGACAVGCAGDASVNDLYRATAAPGAQLRITLELAASAAGGALAPGTSQRFVLSAFAADAPETAVPLGPLGSTPTVGWPVEVAGGALSVDAWAAVPVGLEPGSEGYALRLQLSPAPVPTAGATSRAAGEQGAGLQALSGHIRSGVAAGDNPVTLSCASALAVELLASQGGSLSAAQAQAAYAQLVALLRARQAAVETSLSPGQSASVATFMSAMAAALKSQVVGDVELQVQLAGVLVETGGDGAVASATVAPSASLAARGMAATWALWGLTAGATFSGTAGTVAQLFAPSFVASAAQVAAAPTSAASLAAAQLSFVDTDLADTIGGQVVLQPPRVRGGISGYAVYLGGATSASSRILRLGTADGGPSPALSVAAGTRVPAGATRVWAYPIAAGQELDAAASAPLSNRLAASPAVSAATPPPALPAAPTAVRASGGDGRATLSWSPVEGASSYTVYRDTLANMARTAQQSSELTSPPYAAAGLSNGQRYFFAVSAHNAAGEGPSSQVVSAQPELTLDPPASLGRLAGDGQVLLFWRPVPGATGYLLRRATSPAGSGAVAVRAVVDQSPFLDTDVVNGTTYFYSLSVAHGDTEGPPTSWAPALPQLALQPPQHLTVRPLGSGARLSWSDAGAVSRYCVYVDDHSPVALTGGIPTTAPSLTLADGLSPGRHWATVTTHALDGGISAAAAEVAVDIAPHPHTTGGDATYVVGQASADALAPAANMDGATLHGPPEGIALADDGHLYLADPDASRVLGFAQTPATDGAAADFAVGQDSVSTASPASLAASRLSRPLGLAAAGSQLYVVDQPSAEAVGQASGGTWDAGGPGENSRVLVFTGPSAHSPAAADVVLGAQDFGWSSSTAASARRFAQATGIAVGGGRLLVVDRGAHRVLVYNRLPSVSNVAADLVLGQTDLTGSAAADPPDSTTLRAPSAAWTDGERVLVLDAGNNRLLMWNSFPTRCGQPADNVLGQPDMSSSRANAGGQISAYGLDTGQDAHLIPGVASNGSHIAVADPGNNRVLIWNAFPDRPLVGADVVLGQSSYVTGGAEWISARSLSSPEALFMDGRQLIVGDTGHDRYVVFVAASETAPPLPANSSAPPSPTNRGER